MSKINCPQCEGRDVSITLYTPPDRDVASCCKCGYTSLAEDFPEQSLFDRITQSPEVLAEYLVYESPGYNKEGDKDVFYRSKVDKFWVYLS